MAEKQVTDHHRLDELGRDLLDRAAGVDDGKRAVHMDDRRRHG